MKTLRREAAGEITVWEAAFGPPQRTGRSAVLPVFSSGVYGPADQGSHGKEGIYEKTISFYSGGGFSPFGLLRRGNAVLLRQRLRGIFPEDVTGTTKGKGFQGVIKRHNQSRGPMGHGSHYHRKPGSMGTMRPMRVFKGKKLPGHMGTLTVTIQNLEIIAVDLENNCLLVKGNVPGAKNSLVIIKSAVKGNGKINKAEELTSYEIIENVPNEKDLEPAEENALENAEASESEEA